MICLFLHYWLNLMIPLFFNSSTRSYKLSLSPSFGNCFHASSQHNVKFPFHIFQKMCCWIKNLFPLVIFHIDDPWGKSTTLSFSYYEMSPLYFLFHIFFQTSFPSYKHLHQSFSSKKLLRISISLRPSQPTYFSKLNYHIWIRPIFFPFLFLPKGNICIYLSNYWRRL